MIDKNWYNAVSECSMPKFEQNRTCQPEGIPYSPLLGRNGDMTSVLSSWGSIYTAFCSLVQVATFLVVTFSCRGTRFLPLCPGASFRDRGFRQTGQFPRWALPEASVLCSSLNLKVSMIHLWQNRWPVWQGNKTSVSKLWTPNRKKIKKMRSKLTTHCASRIC
jgi:hypothetical protein